MLAMVGVYYVLSTRKTHLMERTLADNRDSISGLSDRLREQAAHLLRLGDERLHKDGEDPSDLISQVRASGQRLSAFAGDLASYSEALHSRAHAARPKDREDSLKAPSRKVRNGSLSPCASPW